MSEQSKGRGGRPIDADQILSRIVAWSNAEPPIRSLVLVGSRAEAAKVDVLADIDVQIYAESNDPFTRDDRWLSRIAPVWLVVYDQYREADILVPARLVIFAGGVKVDFAFYPAPAVRDVASRWPVNQVLVDKDNAAGRAPRPAVSRGLPRPPSHDEFTSTIREFWFEAYHVAKYLARNELWLAKSRDWAAKQHLLTLIEWHERAKHGWDYDTRYEGKDMRSWVSDDTRQDLHGAFSRFDRDESWDALASTAALFRRLSKDSAAILGYPYPEDVEANISGFILSLRRRTA